MRDIRSVKVFSPTKANRERYAEEMSAKLELEVRAVDTPEAAVEDVDIVSACTNAMEPALKGDWLSPGQHVTDVRGELDARVFERADVTVKQGVAHSRPSNEDVRSMGDGYNRGDYIGGTDEQKQRLPARLRDARVNAGGTDETPTFNDLASGRVSRTSREQITLYLNSGNQGLQFAAVGEVVYRKAKEQGLGRELPTEWFLQDIRD